MQNRPNILFFFPDQHRFDWLGVNPDLPLRTPNLDALCRRGVRFARAFCDSPLCAPSRAALAAGKGYDRCGVVDNGQAYPLRQPTYYQALREAGYHVLGCGKFDLDKPTPDWHLDGSRHIRDWGFTAGIDNEGKFDGSRSFRQAGKPVGPYLKYLHERGFANRYCDEHAQCRRNRGAYTTFLPDEAYCDNWVAENGMTLLRNVPAGEPWHLVINFTGPHNPMEVPQSIRQRWQDVDFPPPHGYDGDTHAPEDHQRNRQNYAGMIENIDRHVGRFLDELRARGEEENTLVVYASDHGEMLGDHGRFGKSTFYHPSIGVPLIVAGPGVRENVVEDALVLIHDLAATFVDYAGATPMPGMEPANLRPLLEGRAAAHRDHVVLGLGDWRVAFDGRYKLVTGVGEAPLLFDLLDDPWEDADIATRQPEKVTELDSLVRRARGKTSRRKDRQMSERPNILFLFSDEHSHRFMGHISPEDGGEADIETPVFDKLAAGGTVFTDAYCQMPLCTPSRISVLTGLEPARCGAWHNSAVLRPELDTIPKALARAGYATCLVGKMHLGGNQQFVGFQHRPYGDLTGRCGHQREPIPDPDTGMRARTTSAVGITGVPESQMQEELVAQESLAWLREHRHAQGDRPWFLCASFSRPHFPLTAPRRWIERYRPDRISRPMFPAGGDAYDHPMSAGMRKGFMAEDIDEAEMMRARAAYFACVSYLDEMIGDMLLRLDAAGFLENTIVVYTTDHGEMAGEHGAWWKNGWYEGCTRVPLIVSTPAQRNGAEEAARCTAPVALLDLFPTFCGLAGTEAPGHLDGVDLSASIRSGVEPAARPIVTDNLIPRWGEGTEFRSVRKGKYKYVRFRSFPPLFFDLEDDPGERKNLFARGCSGEAEAALRELEAFANESIDFDEAENLRTVRDGKLHEEYPQTVNPHSGGNCYFMPSGRIIAGDDLLYEPTVIAENPEDAFGDYAPGRG